MLVANARSFCNLIHRRSSTSPTRSSTMGRHETPLACSRSRRVWWMRACESAKKRESKYRIVDKFITFRLWNIRVRGAWRRKNCQKSKEEQIFFSLSIFVSFAYLVSSYSYKWGKIPVEKARSANLAVRISGTERTFGNWRGLFVYGDLGRSDNTQYFPSCRSLFWHFSGSSVFFVFLLPFVFSFSVFGER